MRNFILSAETACDLNEELITKYGVSVMPMKFYIDGEEYLSGDGRISEEGICEKMRAGAKTSTSQPNPSEVEEYLEKLLTQGKDILHLSFSSAMSGTCNTFKTIAEQLNQTHDNKIYVVDTLCQSAGVGLLLSIVAEKAEEVGMSVEEARDYCESKKLNIVHYFSVDTFTYLARGGRIPAYLATVGNLIKLKPVLELNDEGKIVAAKKLIGKKRALDELVRNFCETYDGQSKLVYFVQADCQDDAEYVKSEIIKIFPEIEVTILPLGTVIVAHSGPGTLALFYTAEKR